VGRYTICAAPAFYLLVATAISRIDNIVPIYLSLFALMIVIVPGLQDYYGSDVNEQWRETAAYVQENIQPDDVVIFAPNEENIQQDSFNWYYQGEVSECSIRSQIKGDLAIEEALSNCISGHERFWVIVRGTPEVVERMKSFFLNPGNIEFYLIEEQEFIQIMVYLFAF